MKVRREYHVWVPRGEFTAARPEKRRIEPRHRRPRIVGGQRQAAVEIRVEAADDELDRSLQIRGETHFLDEALVILDFLDPARLRCAAGTRSDGRIYVVALILGLVHLAGKIGSRR